MAPTRLSLALGQAAVALHEGEVASPREDLGGAVALAADYAWPEYTVDLLELLGVTARLHGEHERAGRLGAASAIRDAIGVRYRLSDQEAWIDASRDTSNAVNADTWATVVSEGLH